MLKKLFKSALAVSALALTFGLAAPHAAEARIVCHAGWGWHGDRCVRVHRVYYDDYGRPYHRVRYVPPYWHHHHHWHPHRTVIIER